LRDAELYAILNIDSMVNRIRGTTMRIDANAWENGCGYGKMGGDGRNNPYDNEYERLVDYATNFDLDGKNNVVLHNRLLDLSLLGEEWDKGFNFAAELNRQRSESDF